MKSLKVIAVSVVVLLAAACGGSKGKGANTVGPDGKPLKPGDAVVGEAKSRFEAGLEKMIAHDKKADWNDALCTEVASDFAAAAELQRNKATNDSDKKFAAAHYNAGLAFQRCSKDGDAKAKFQAAVGDDPQHHRARVQLALYTYKEKGDAVLDDTIKQLQDAVLEAKFQNVDALVNLAMLEMKRGGTADWQGCKGDYDCAKLNIRRALAIDDGYMPAFNQLALYYFNLAKAKAQPESKGKKGAMVAASGKKAQLSGQMLDLAALVCSQAIRKNASYAPIHNTAGLIQVELKNVNSAVGSFNTARQLDPNFFEAQMNYAAVNLSFRGFDQAENAYRQALKMRPASFEAHLGLALALRGMINDSNWDKNLAEAQKELDECKKLDAARPETYYNEAILTQEYKAKVSSGDNAKAIEMLKQAKTIYDQFIQKAGGAAEYTEAVKRSNERKDDLEKMIKFLTEGEKERKKMEQEEAEKAAQQAAPTAPGGIDENAEKEGEPKKEEPPKEDKK